MNGNRPVQRLTFHSFSLIGLAVGLLFPLLGTLLESARLGKSGLSGWIFVQRSSPLLWLLDLIPLVLTITSAMIPAPQSKAPLVRNNNLIRVLLGVMALLPFALLFLTLETTQREAQVVRDANQSAALRHHAIQAYIATNQLRDGSATAHLQRMIAIREELWPRYSTAISAMNPAWNSFQSSLRKKNRVDLKTANTMQQAADTLTHAIEASANSERSEDTRIFVTGLGALVIAFVMMLYLLYQLRLAESRLIANNRQHEKTNKQLEEANQKLETLNQKLEEHATQDPLTGLSNRRAFDARLAMEWQRALRYSEPLTLVLLDVDHFKDYNDSFGHPAGDTALKLLGKLVGQACRSTDLAARYGGEEFVLILPHTSVSEGARLAERLRMAIECLDWPHRSLTASFGIAAVDSTVTSIDALIARTDAALYRAKRERNRICLAELPTDTAVFNTETLLDAA